MQNKKIYTNAIDIHFPHGKSKLNEKHHFFKLTQSKGSYFKDTDELFSSEILRNRVESIAYFNQVGESHENYVIIMTDQESFDVYSMRALVDNLRGGEKLIVKQIGAEDLKDFELTQLLLNACVVFQSNESWSSLMGRPILFKKEFTPQKNWEFQRVGLEFKVQEEEDVNYIEMNVKTFTERSHWNMIDFQGKPSNIYTAYKKYTLSEDQISLVPYNESKDSSKHKRKLFIERQIKGTKSSIERHNLSSYDKFLKTKNGSFYEVMNRMNYFYEDLVSIKQRSFDEISEISLSNEDKKIFDTMIKKNRLNNISIFCADSTDKELTTCRDLLKKEFDTLLTDKKDIFSGIQTVYADEPSKTGWNIMIVHDPEYYKNNKTEDPYQKKFPGTILQHVISTDQFLKAEIRNILYQLMIKTDVLNQNYTFSDWPLKDTTEFLYYEYDFDKSIWPRLHGIRVKMDGTWNPVSYDLDEDSEEFANIPVLQKEKNEKIEIIRVGDYFYQIEKTPFRGMPNVNSLAKNIQLADEAREKGRSRSVKGPRAQENSEQDLRGISNIRTLEINNEVCYLCSNELKGISYSQDKGVVIRKIISLNGGEDITEMILPLMNNVFIRNQRVTVIPFPFKYVRELEELEGF